MKVVGIIAEYNPFHNGHAYHIRRAKELTGAEYCVAAMSGDFVQRGEPAVFDKYTRARMALSSGADLVLEIPPIFATGSAEDFASCGAALLDRLGVVDALCFGSECGETEPMMEIAKILCEEPEIYRKELAAGLKNGLTFPQARQNALEAYLADGSHAASGVSLQPGTDFSALLSSPNNILGIEYCRALLRRKSQMEPITVPRQGSGYHDTHFPGKQSVPGTGSAAPNEPFSSALAYPSAAAIREILNNGSGQNDGGIRPHFTALSQSVPAPVLTLIRDAYPLTAEDFSAALAQRLLALQLADRPLTDFYDVPENLAARIGKRTLEFAGFADRCAALKTRQYTYTRISRALIHIMLDMTAQDARARKEHDYISYVRVLGFRREAEPLLSAISRSSRRPCLIADTPMTSALEPSAVSLAPDSQAASPAQSLSKKAAPLPLITRTADAASVLDETSLTEFRRDLYCSHIYQAVLAAKSGRRIANEYTTGLIVM